MAFSHFLKELSSGFRHPAYLLYSTDYYLLYEAFTGIKRSLGDEAFNFDIFDGESADGRQSMDTIVDVLNTLPFGALRRTVMIRNLQKYPKNDYKKIEAYVNRPSESSLLFMLYEGKLPKSFESLSAPKVRKIPLTVADHEIVPFMREKAGRSGLRMDEKTAEFLISTVGSELGALCSEIEKLSTLGKSVLTEEEIKAIIYSDIEYTAFDLATALDRGDAPRAFLILEHLSKSAEPHMVLGALNWHYKNMRTRGGKEAALLPKVFHLLHGADVALKTSHGAVLEELLCALLQITRSFPERPRESPL